MVCAQSTLEHLEFTSFTEALTHLLQGGVDQVFANKSSQGSVSLTLRRRPANLSVYPCLEQSHLHWSDWEGKWLLSQWYLTTATSSGLRPLLPDELIVRAIAALRPNVLQPFRLGHDELLLIDSPLGQFACHHGSPRVGAAPAHWFRVLSTLGISHNGTLVSLAKDADGFAMQLGPFPVYDNQEASVVNPMTAWRLAPKPLPVHE